MLKTEAPFALILVRRLRLILNCKLYSSALMLLIFCTLVVPAFGQTPVLTQHNDNARTGQNTSETILNTSNVKVNQFGKLFTMPVDGQVYAQPLYAPGVTINGSVHNVVIIATENDSVYAYDADSKSVVLLWKASMVDAAHGAGSGETPLNSATTIGCTDLQPLIGITATPVIDLASKTVYVEAKSTNGPSYFHRLHALDLLTGNEKSPGPIHITATVAGTGDGSTNGQLVFESPMLSLHQHARPGLLLLNGTVYISYASHCDSGPYHGWLFAYDAATFTRKSVYVTTPNGGLGGFWMGGTGIAADTSGNIYIPSGNGDFDTTNIPARETGDTLLKLGTTNQILTQLDYFTPENQADLRNSDTDLGSGGALLLPDQPGSFPHILVQAGKQGRIYVVNRDQMTTSNSHYCSGCTNDPEIIEESASGAVGSMFTSPAYWNGSLFFWGTNDVLKSIPISSGIPDFAHLTGNTQVVNFPGPGLSVSSNGTTTGTAIVWAINAMEYGSPGPGPGPAILYAYDATNIQTLLYSSSQNAARDTAGNAVKFTVPTVANGKVYLGTSTEVDVYGLLGGGLPVTATPVINPASETTSSPIQVTIIDSTPASTIFYTTDNSTPSPTNGTKYTSAFTLTSSATVKAIATATNFQNSAVASAVYTIGSSSTTINYSSGFTPSGLTLSGSAKISGTRLRLTDTAGREAGSGFFSTPVNVQSFTTDFSFQLTSPNGDGFTFTIHGGSSAAALGASGGGLGYGPDTPGGTPGIPNSVAVKFDLYNNAGEGSDSTGIYTDGASPTVPSFDMTSSGVNLHSGDVFRVHMTYDGTNLAMTITDTSTGKVFSHTFSNINIPGAVGANAGYVGFTGGTGGSTAIQEIITWTFSSGTASQASTPQISPAPGSYTGPVTVTIMDATSGATITYTTDGSTPVPGSHGTAISSGGSFALTSTATVKAIASASGFSNSSIATAAYTITQSSQTPINFGSGFAGETTLILNGGASINGTRLRLTDSGGGEARSAFNTAAVSVSQFVSDFTFQLTNPIADGFTFTIQGISPTVVGPSGGGLGYGAGMPGGTPGIAKSVAIKFDLYNNAGEGADSTGAYLNGASPTIPASDMTSSGVNLHSGDVFHVHVTYDGVTLAWSITDTSTGKSFSSSTSVNIPSIVGSNTAYVGFTGGTGGSTATQEILTWTYSTSTSKASSIQFETESSVVFGGSVSSGPTYRIFTWSGFTDGSGTTLDGTAIGQFVTITLNIPQAGTYDIRYATKKYFSRGIVQLSVNGANVGPAEDQYAASDAWQEIDLGTVTLGAGNQQLKFSTTGKNASSSGFTQAYDYIKLIPQ